MLKRAKNTAGHTPPLRGSPRYNRFESFAECNMPPAIGQHYEFEGQRYVVVEATDDMGGLVRGMNGDGDDCWFDTKGAVLVENTVCTDENTLVATVQTDDVVATAQTDSTVQTEVQYTLPGLRTDNPAEILPLHRLLLALRDSSVAVGC